MPSGERKMLFAETTNKQAPPISDNIEKSKMDISLCDLSMRDVELRYPSKPGPKSSTTKYNDVETSKMDISLVDRTMLDEDIIAVKPLPTKPTKKAPKKLQESQQMRASKRPIRQRRMASTQELEAH
jgi:hypothetical protein